MVMYEQMRYFWKIVYTKTRVKKYNQLTSLNIIVQFSFSKAFLSKNIIDISAYFLKFKVFFSVMIC